MRIRKFIAVLLAVTAAAGIAAPAPVFAGAEYSWDFNEIGEMPEHFEFNKEVDTVKDVKSGDNSPAFGIAAGKGEGKGTATLDGETGGVNILKGEQIGGAVSVSYEFASQNSSVMAYLVAPRFGEDAAIAAAVTLDNGSVVFDGEQIAGINVNEWHKIGVRYETDGESVTADVYFDETKVIENRRVEVPAGGIKYFSVLVNSRTTTGEYRATKKFVARKEILLLDNLYIGESEDCFVSAFKASACEQGDGFDEIIVSFNKDIDSGSVSAGSVSVDGLEVEGVACDGKRLIARLKEPMVKGNTYRVTAADSICGIGGERLAKAFEFSITAKIPRTVNMLWDFNDQNPLPEYFAYNNQTVPVITTETGASGEAGDGAYKFLIGIGGGRPSPSQIIDKYTNGFNILNNALDSNINGVRFCYDMDFRVLRDYMIAWLFAPNWGSMNNYGKIISLEGGSVLFDNREIGKVNAGQWHNIGVVCTLSANDGLLMDVYFDSKKVVSGYSDKSSAVKSGIKCFSVYASARTPETETESRFDDRQEYFLMDNLYIGNDFSRVAPKLCVDSSSPADGAANASVQNGVRLAFNKEIPDNAGDFVKVYDSKRNETAVSNIDISDDCRNMELTFADNLKYSESYSVEISDGLKAKDGSAIVAGTRLRFKTESAFASRLTVENFARADASASADVSLSSDKAAAVIMASYDSDGIQDGISVKETAAGENSFKMEVASKSGSTVKVFAVDAVKSCRLIADPFVENGDEGGYYMNNTAIDLNEPECKNGIVKISGRSNMRSGYAVCKAAETEKYESENAADYLGINLARTDEDGSFETSFKTEKIKGTYRYSVLAPDMDEPVSGSVDYEIKTGNEILSLLLNKSSCKISNNEITLQSSFKDLSGLLAEFTLSENARLYAGERELISGESRINCTNAVTLTVLAESGEKHGYTLRVTKARSESTGGSGGSGGSGSSGGGSNIRLELSGSAPAADEIPEPIEERVFADVPGMHWAVKAIEALAERKIVSGVSETEFDPEREVTREEFAGMLKNAFGYMTKGSRISFDDVSEGTWYYDAVYALAENGIVSGIQTHLFGVGSRITRQDMAVMAYRCISGGSGEKIREYESFADDDDISEYAREAVKEMYCMGYISGTDNGMFAPQGSATRAQAAYLINAITQD